ncbi:hypothetical protein [Chryseolinea sp. H1M3-3]|uniref:hypothetical protein n=1 Tax=Chryseolinea sp. H1M3-3 TaxID=3034144 RepID=UPI0023EB5423|nr:hypothetical protein [Chryseolinea sp. H1M3-3]
MNIAILQSSNRPLFINFDQYTDGDSDFKKELIYLMIDNLKEVQTSLTEATQKNKLEIFEKTCHKIKPTLSMLEDKDLLESIQAIKSQFSNGNEKDQWVASFTSTCNQIIKSLERESK